ncbi:MAG: hypothetical protein ABI743_08030 [bacterium]
MILGIIPRPWLGPLLRWWIILGISLGLVVLVAPKQYTAYSRISVKLDRLPWATFKTSKLPTIKDKNSLSALLDSQGLNSDVLNVWQEVAFAFLLDQLAFDAYDFRPFFNARTATLTALDRSGFRDEIQKNKPLPDDLLAQKLAAGMKADFDENTGVLSLSYTADTPEIAEGMLREYVGLLGEQVDHLLDEKDTVAMAGIQQRIAEIKNEVDTANAEATAYRVEHHLPAPTAVLSVEYARLVQLVEKRTRAQALSDAADTYVAELDARLQANEVERGTDAALLFDLGADTEDQAKVSTDVYKDPVLTLLREQLFQAYVLRDKDELVITEAHPRMELHHTRIAELQNSLRQRLLETSRSEELEYVIRGAEAHARSVVFDAEITRIQASMEQYPDYEEVLLALYRTVRIRGALLKRMYELEDMANSMLEKRESMFKIMDPPMATERWTEPKFYILGPALFLLGTLGAWGWLAWRDRVVLGLQGR